MSRREVSKAGSQILDGIEVSTADYYTRNEHPTLNLPRVEMSSEMARMTYCSLEKSQIETQMLALLR